jgi:DNA mismatch repair protein MutS2
MEEHTLRLLEFDKVRDLVDQYAPSDLGRERIRNLQPSTDRTEIEADQSLTAEMVQTLAAGETLPLSELRDVRPLVRRAKVEASLRPNELKDVAATLLGLRQVRDAIVKIAGSYPLLAEHAGRIHDCSQIAYEIDATIDRRGEVVDSASRELVRLRSEITKLDKRIRTRMQRLLRSPVVKKALRFPNYTVTGPHYVLPVHRDYRQEIAGIVHRASASGETLYIEPAEVATLAAEMALVRRNESREVARILRHLSAEVGRIGRVALDSLEVAARLCCVHAQARFAREFATVRPEFTDDGRLRLEQARHPLLEHLRHQRFRVRGSGISQTEPVAASEHVDMDHGRNGPEGSDRPVLNPEFRTLNPPVVPISLHLGDRFDMLVITGPNTGGKTVALKTVGLLAVMAQAGLHIPAAAGSRLPVFDAVLADIGDEQSIEQSLSTFSSHMTRVAHILSVATSRSLVLLDELGAGTDPAEGAALGRAILDELLRRGSRTLATTHLGDLKLYALAQARAENAAVEFDVETLRPTYHVSIGDTGQSSALVIARRLRLDGPIVDRAEHYLEEARAGRPRELEMLEQRRAEAEQAREHAWRAEQQARDAKLAFETRLRELDHHAADALALEEFRATLRPGDVVHVRKFRRPGTVRRVDHKRRTATVAHGSMQWELAIEELEPQLGQK